MLTYYRQACSFSRLRGGELFSSSKILRQSTPHLAKPANSTAGLIGWYYLSNAPGLIRPRLFYACFVVSRIANNCYTLRHF